MVLFLIGVAVTLYMIREVVRLWHEPDAVRWVGPVELDPQVIAEFESDLHAAAEAPGPEPDGHGHGPGKDPTKSKQLPKCPYRQGNFTFEKPHVEPASCCNPTPSEQAKSKLSGAVVESGMETQLSKLIATLPKEVRDKILDEADKIEKMRKQANALSHFVQKPDGSDAPPPPPAVPPEQ